MSFRLCLARELSQNLRLTSKLNKVPHITVAILVTTTTCPRKMFYLIDIYHISRQQPLAKITRVAKTSSVRASQIFFILLEMSLSLSWHHLCSLNVEATSLSVLTSSSIHDPCSYILVVWLVRGAGNKCSVPWSALLPPATPPLPRRLRQPGVWPLESHSLCGHWSLVTLSASGQRLHPLCR